MDACQRLDRMRRRALDIVYPRAASCAVCGEDSEVGALCSRCAGLFDYAGIERNDVNGLSFLRAAFAYERPIDGMIRRFKYDKHKHLARFFAMNLLHRLPRGGYVLADVPLHPKRRRERGFSQTEELCLEMAYLGDVPYLRSAILRTRDTPSQAHLSGAERKVNLADAFRALPTVAGKRIVLIDDVATTGTTLRESAQALLEAGALEVGAVVIAT